MNLMRLSLRNARRHPRRMLLTGLAVGIAVAAVTFMDAYVKGFTESILETFVQLEAGHIKIVPLEAADRSRPLPLEKGIKQISEIVSIAKSTPGITDVSPRIRFPVLLERGSSSIPALGIALSPSREKRLMSIDELVTEGSAPSDSAWDVALGFKLAEKLGIGIGDELFMVTTDSYGGLGPGLYRVTGIIRTGVGYIDKKTFYVPLLAGQEQLYMDDMAMEVVCRVEDGLDGAKPVAERLNEDLKKAGRSDVVALPWQEQGTLYRMMATAKIVGPVIMLLLGLIALTTVVNTVLMSVMERTREIGMLRALGFERGTIVKLLLGESLVIGIAGTFFGLVLGLAVSLLLQHTGIDFSGAMENIEWPMKPILYPDPSVMTAVKAAIFGLILTLVAAWYPARKAVKLAPAEALRSN
ncbi:ABC transporter permease [bacterium]|nr:ABC transporter permease [bacterium]